MHLKEIPSGFLDFAGAIRPGLRRLDDHSHESVRNDAGGSAANARIFMDRDPSEADTATVGPLPNRTQITLGGCPSSSLVGCAARGRLTHPTSLRKGDGDNYCFFGRPRSRIVNSRPSCWTVCRVHPSDP